MVVEGGGEDRRGERGRENASTGAFYPVYGQARVVRLLRQEFLYVECVMGARVAHNLDHRQIGRAL